MPAASVCTLSSSRWRITSLARLWQAARALRREAAVLAPGSECGCSRDVTLAGGDSLAPPVDWLAAGREGSSGVLIGWHDGGPDLDEPDRASSSSSPSPSSCGPAGRGLPSCSQLLCAAAGPLTCGSASAHVALRLLRRVSTCCARRVALAVEAKPTHRSR